jgi:hypothetical protein
MHRQRLDVTALYNTLDRRRCTKGLTWTQVSEQTGLAAPLFSRMAAGRTVSAEAYLTLCQWLSFEVPFTKDEL